MAGNRQPITQPSIAPTTKVAAGGAAGALTVLVVWILGLLHVPVPPEVASAITVLISFITSYFVRQRIPAAAINPGTSGGGAAGHKAAARGAAETAAFHGIRRPRCVVGRGRSRPSVFSNSVSTRD